MKKLFVFLLACMPFVGMATDVVTDPDTGLKYCTDAADKTDKTQWYIYTYGSNNLKDADGNALTIEGTAANLYFTPYSNFRVYVRNQCSAGSDGKIYYNTLTTLTTFSSSYSYADNVSEVSFQGIEYFPELKSFTVNNSSSANSVVADFSRNTKLATLTFNSSNIKLTKLNISNTQLEAFTLPTGSTSTLTELAVANTKLTELDLSSCTKLASVTYDSNKLTFKSDNTGGLKLSSPEAWEIISSADGVTVMENLSLVTSKIVDLSGEAVKTANLSKYTKLTSLTLIGVESVTMPTLASTYFELTATQSPDLQIDFGNQPTITSLTLRDLNQVDISGCAKITTLNLRGDNWGDLSEGHLGLICNTGATEDVPTLPALTQIYASTDGAPKRIDLTHAAMNLTFIGINNSLTEELIIPDHIKLKGEVNSGGTAIKIPSPLSDTLTRNRLRKLDVSGCTGLTSININDNETNRKVLLEEVYAHGCTSLQTFTCISGQLRTLDMSGCTNLTKLTLTNNFLKTVNLSNCHILTTFIAHRNEFEDLDFLTVPYDDGTRTETDIANMEQIQVNGGTYMVKLGDNDWEIIRQCSGKIRRINTKYLSRSMKKFLVADNLLTELDVSTFTGIKEIQCENNMLTTLDLSQLPTDLDQAKWGSDMNNANGNDVMQVGFLNVEVIKGTDESGENDWIALRLPNGAYKHSMDNNIGLYNTLEDARAGINRIAAEATPFMGTVAEFNTERGTTLETEGHGDNEYIFLHSMAEIMADNGGKAADRDLYGKILTYRYNTRFNEAAYNAAKENGEEYTGLDPHIDIRAHIWPYIMYVNKATKSTESNNTGINYYAGTIYLDYDAVIPKGVEIYIATGFTDNYTPVGDGTATYDEQLKLVKVGEPGQVIPKNTAVIVKSTIAAGLYDFQTAWDFDYHGWEDYRNPYNRAQLADQLEKKPDELRARLHGVEDDDVLVDKEEYDRDAHPELWIDKVYKETYGRDLAEDNLLKGCTEDMTVTAKTILTLGREKGVGTMKLGFWKYNSTKLAAHRCYIPASALEGHEQASAKGGANFFFGDDGIVTTIHPNTEWNEVNGKSVYDLQGRKLSDKATLKKGIYVINGKKTVVK